MVDSTHSRISIARQCKILSISRSSYYYSPTGESEYNLHLMTMIDQQYMETPFYGSRQMARHLRRSGHEVSRKRVRRLMRLMGIQAIYQSPRTSMPNTAHKIYPYLLKNLRIDKPNQVWCSEKWYPKIGRYAK